MSYFDDFISSVPESRVAPVHQWQPPLSGDMDLLIKKDGSWWHESQPIKRQALVALFASLIRYEPDLGYVLVSPVEKWKITVEDVPFIAELLEQTDGNLRFATKYAGIVGLSKSHPMTLRSFEGVTLPYILVRDDLYARVSRNVYYELAAMSEEFDGVMGIWSDGCFWPME